jgi:primary-amine oxidase
LRSGALRPASSPPLQPWIHPISFFQYIDVSGSDPSQFSVLKIVYNHQVFSSTADFIAAWKNKTLKRLPARPDQDPREGGDPDAWSTRRRPPGAQDRDLDDLPGPRSVSFAGLRFRVDRATQFVSWMGWQMFLGFDRDMGLSLWDVRFRGERIIYEVRAASMRARAAADTAARTS